MMRASTRYLAYIVMVVFYLLLVYRLSMLLPQIKVLFSFSLIVIPTFLSMFLGFKVLRSKGASANNMVLCIASLALVLPFLSSLVLCSVGFPSLLASIYAPPLIIVILIVFSCLVVAFVPPIRGFLTELASSTSGGYARRGRSPHMSATSGQDHMFLASRLGFGRFAVLAGMSVLGIPRGFPTSGNKLTQDIEGILSSREELGSYSTGFLTSLSKLNEQLVFEVQVSKRKVSVYFYVAVTSRSLKEATRRASSAIQGIRGAISGAYGENVNVNTLTEEELSSVLGTIFGGQPIYHVRPVNDDEDSRSYDVHGVVAKVIAVNENQYYGGSVWKDVRYLSALRLREGFPALRASGDEDQVSTLINSLLNLDATSVSFIVNFKPHKSSLLKRLQTKGAANTLKDSQGPLRDKWTFQDVLKEEKSLRELNEVRYGESSGYWKVSLHLVVASKSALGALRSLEGAKAALTSIFSDPNFTVQLETLRGKQLLGAINSLPLRRMTSGRLVEMSSVRLSALIHMPTRAYPGIDRRELPEFEVPQPLEESRGEKLVLGRVMHGDRELYPVGIDLKDLVLNMVVVGHIGTGKTMFVSQLLLNLWEADPSIGFLIFDLKGEYAPIREILPEGVELYRPGDESSPLKLNVFDCGVDNPENHALKLFAIFRDTFSSLFEEGAELSPQMERLCRDALMRTVADRRRWSFDGFYTCLEEQARLMQPSSSMITSSLEAIKNRVEKFRHGVLRRVFDVGSTNIDFNAITGEKVIVDLSFLLSHGGTKDDVRLLMNVVLKNVFDRAMKLGLTRTVRHVVVVEEAGLLVPEVFSRRTSSETTPAEDIALVERALGEGMILVSQRPTISENILANSGTKVVFRCPYDSRRVARFLNLNKAQERHLKVLPKREAIVTIPNYSYPFRIRTLDSELSILPPSQARVEPSTTALHGHQHLNSTFEEDEDLEDDIADDSFNEDNVFREEDVIGDTPNATIADEDYNRREDDKSPPENIGAAVGSVEILAIPENYFAGKFSEESHGDISADREGDTASRFRAFIISLVESGKVFAFKLVFHQGRGRFLIQCKEQGVDRLKRTLQDLDAALHSWFPEFETKLHYSDAEEAYVLGRRACGWVSNLPAPSRNPMKHVVELFIQRKLTGRVTVIAARSEVIDARLQAKCWIAVECQNSTDEEAEMDLDLVLRTFTAAYTYEGEHHELRSGRFPRREAEAVHRLTSKLIPRGESTVLLPSDLALYFWLPETDTVARVKRKGEFLAPTKQEMMAGEICLGKVLRHGNPTDEEVRLSSVDMGRHCAVMGSSGGGKTYTTFVIMLDLHKLGIPFLMLDPVKKEGRSLIGAIPGLRVFTVGDETTAPLRFNILRVPQGVKPQKHIDMVYAALCASVVMYAPAPYVLQIALNETFAKNGWDLTQGKRGRDVTLLELKETVKEIVQRAGYDSEARNNITAALTMRFESLSQAGKGAALCSSVSMSPRELITQPTVVEFGEMGAEEDRAMVILMMLLSVYEYLQTLGPTSKPRCAIVVEEAGSLFSNVEGKGGVDYDSKEARRKAIEVISRITAEIRSLGAIMIFVNQSAVNLPIEITQNTSTKIIHQLADDADADKVARMLGLNEEQKRALTSLEVGKPIIKTPSVSHPFQVQVSNVTKYGVNPTKFVTDQELRTYMEKTFYDAHPEYLRAQTAATSMAMSAAQPAVLSIINEDRLAESIVASREFKEQYGEAVSRGRKARNVEPLLDLLVTEAARYKGEPNGIMTLALKIFVKAANKFNEGANPLARMDLVSIVERELAKRASASRARPRYTAPPDESH